MDPKTCHMGDLVLDCFRRRPNVICHIDAATGEAETNASVLSRSIRLANALRAVGLVPGNVVALSGRNHNDLHIPYYAALFNGLPLVGVDPFFKFDEIKSLLKLTLPKITFCEEEDYEVYERAAKDINLEMRIVTFGNGKNSMKAFVEQYAMDGNENDFKAVTLDRKKSYVWLISTSGTSGAPKVAATTHDAFVMKTLAYTSQIKTGDLTDENYPALNLSPVQWVSGLFNPVGMPLLGQTLVQTSASPTPEHIIDVINKYRPQQTLIGPNLLSQIVKHDKKCDLTCFKSIILGGAKVPDDLIPETKSRMAAGSLVVQMYGQTESLGPVLAYTLSDSRSCGREYPMYVIKLVDPDTGAEITEPHVTGEMYLKGNIFTEYYNSPEETKNAFTDDGWYKTGDLFYKNEDNNFFYVERLKTLIKYQNYHVTPSEVERVIRSHPGVADVVVTGVPHPSDGERAAACVLRAPGVDVTERDIVELVANNLSEKKQLRGGVIFLDEFPYTSTGKVSLRAIKDIAITMTR